MRSTPRQDELAVKADADSPETFNLLVIDDEADIREVIGRALASEQVQVHTAGTLDDARGQLAERTLDMVLLDVGMPDGDGLAFAAELSADHPHVQTIVITGRATTEHAVAAMRAGAVDFLAKPLDLDELTERVTIALHAPRHDPQRDQQLRRLKRLCRKLNRSRHDITQQVDILCNDLVTAYQELASQMHHVETTTTFKAMLEDELDLEQLLRRMMEFVLDKIGPTNAVIFLPAHEGGFTVGGYVNYSCQRESAPVLLQHLADAVAPRIAEEPDVMWLTDHAMIEAWLGDDAAWLTDAQVIAGGCREGDDVLAAVMLFRDGEESFEDAHYELIEAICPVFAAHLVKVINIHHRRHDLFGPDGDGDPSGDYDWLNGDDDEGGLAA